MILTKSLELVEFFTPKLAGLANLKIGKTLSLTLDQSRVLVVFFIQFWLAYLLNYLKKPKYRISYTALVGLWSTYALFGNGNIKIT